MQNMRSWDRIFKDYTGEIIFKFPLRKKWICNNFGTEQNQDRISFEYFFLAFDSIFDSIEFTNFYGSTWKFPFCFNWVSDYLGRGSNLNLYFLNGRWPIPPPLRLYLHPKSEMGVPNLEQQPYHIVIANAFSKSFPTQKI